MTDTMLDFFLVNCILPLLFGLLLICSKGIIANCIAIITLIGFEILIYLASYQKSVTVNESITENLLFYLPGLVIVFIYIIITVIKIITTELK